MLPSYINLYVLWCDMWQVCHVNGVHVDFEFVVTVVCVCMCVPFRILVYVECAGVVLARSVVC